MTVVRPIDTGATRRMFRYPVPVDGAWYQIPGTVRHVGSRNPDIVEVWCEVQVNGDLAVVSPERTQVRVFGTGETIPEATFWLGSTLAAGGRLVWHLVGRTPHSAGRGGPRSRPRR